MTFPRTVGEGSPDVSSPPSPRDINNAIIHIQKPLTSQPFFDVGPDIGVEVRRPCAQTGTIGKLQKTIVTRSAGIRDVRNPATRQSHQDRR
jgi:hypothetical protein